MRVFCQAVLLVCVLAYGCRKAKGPADVRSAQQNNNLDSATLMSAMVNGQPWKTDSAFSYRVASSANDSGVMNLQVIATGEASSMPGSIIINISNYHGISSYNIEPPLNNATYYSNNRRFYATSGSFDVSKDSGNVISGTFSFIADTVAVTNGKFSLVSP